ncbi:MAG: SRPBCC domain-containing protein [Fibrobacterota bacterium]|nr:SRPBCC domain-containing protein [Fibrobacterota bacterium]QQS06026.1 MAG: SRPBCC domain-containing protein [Fibrobacterota bacterium]
MPDFRNERILEASPSVVFQAHRDPKRLAVWWGPDGFTNTFTTFEFTPGGKWSFVMHGPDGKDYPNESVFLEIEENARIHIDHVCEPLFKLDIRLHPHGAGTRVEWLAEFENKTFAKSMESFLLSANEQNLDRLAAEVAKG